MISKSLVLIVQPYLPACTALTDEGARCKYVLNLLWDTFCESPAVNTLTQVTCPDTGNDALYVVDAVGLDHIPPPYV